MPTSISLLVPGLLGDPLFAPAMRGISLPVLDNLFSAIAEEFPATKDYEQQLIALLGGSTKQSQRLSMAQLLGQGRELDHPAYLLASFVHLQADSGRLLMFGDDGLEIDDTETQQWLEELRPIFAAHDIEIEALSAECCLLGLRRKPDSVFSAPQHVIGQDIHRYMPDGEDGAMWRSLVNEVQMQLHQSSVNTERQARGQKAVNSLWLWGDGDSVNLEHNVWQCMVSDDATARLLAKRIGINKLISLAQGDQLFDQSHDYQLIVDTTMIGSTRRQDFDTWYSRLNLFIETIAEPVLQALNNKQLKEVQIYPVNGFYYRVRPSGFGRLFRFFHKQKTFASYLAENS